METIRYSKTFKEDLALGNGTEKVTLADGRVVSLTKFRLPVVISSDDEAVTQGASTHAITFSDIGTTNYQVLVELSWWTYVYPSSKTATGCTLNFADEAPASATLRYMII